MDAASQGKHRKTVQSAAKPKSTFSWATANIQQYLDPEPAANTQPSQASTLPYRLNIADTVKSRFRIVRGEECDICRKKIDQTMSIDEHKKKFHSLQCTECETFTTFDPKELKVHLKSGHPSLINECSSCGLQYKTWQAFRNHFKTKRCHQLAEYVEVATFNDFVSTYLSDFGLQLIPMPPTIEQLGLRRPVPKKVKKEETLNDDVKHVVNEQNHVKPKKRGRPPKMELKPATVVLERLTDSDMKPMIKNGRKQPNPKHYVYQTMGIEDEDMDE